jgi:hypothetical protein
MEIFFSEMLRKLKEEDFPGGIQWMINLCFLFIFQRINDCVDYERKIRVRILMKFSDSFLGKFLVKFFNLFV